MSVIIEEFEAEIASTRPHEAGGEGEFRPTEDLQRQSVIDLLELTQERKARLAVD